MFFGATSAIKNRLGFNHGGNSFVAESTYQMIASKRTPDLSFNSAYKELVFSSLQIRNLSDGFEDEDDNTGQTASSDSLSRSSSSVRILPSGKIIVFRGELTRRTRGSFFSEKICKWLTQLLLVVDYLHSHRVLHRDLKGALDNLGSLKQEYGLAKTAIEVLLVIEAYKAPRDLAPYPPSHVVGHLEGSFAFVLFDKATSTLFVATDQAGKVHLYWGITVDGYVAFADYADLLKGTCGKSLASFPEGVTCILPRRMFLYNSNWGTPKLRDLKNKITAVPGPDEEIWGAKSMVKGATVLAATK